MYQSVIVFVQSEYVGVTSRFFTNIFIFTPLFFDTFALHSLSKHKVHQSSQLRLPVHQPLQ
ncbi:hypothetical protein HOG21_02910 [bacterium]|nr:hypothetical protein [bacterium]